MVILAALVAPPSVSASVDAPLRAGGAPSCGTSSRSIANHAPREFTLACTDPEGDPLTYTADTPVNGTLSPVTGDKVTFTPSGYGAGSGRFHYTASDGNSSGSGTISLQWGANQGAACGSADPTPKTKHNTATTISIVCADPEGDSFTKSVQTQPAHGTVTVDGVYTPNTGYVGHDSFVIRADDGLPTGIRDNTIGVDVTNARPTCTPASVVTPNHTPISITPDCSDADGDPLTFAARNPTSGTVSVVNGKIVFTPTGDSTAFTQFVFTASDGLAGGTSTDTQGYVQVQANLAPSCTRTALLTTNHDTPVGFDVTCTDAEGDPVTLGPGPAPAHGSVDLAARTYSPAAHYAGEDAFSVVASDGHGGSQQQDFSVSVSNQRPTCSPDVAAVRKNHTPFAITLSCTDPEGDPLTYTVDSAAHGSVTGTAPDLIFTPAGDFAGQADLNYVVSDGVDLRPGQSDTYTASFTVPADHAPVCQSIAAVTTDVNTPVTITPSCTDDEGDALALAVTEAPAAGTATVTGGSITYTPSGTSGPVTFTVSISDGHGGATTRDVTVFICAGATCGSATPTPVPTTSPTAVPTTSPTAVPTTSPTTSPTPTPTRSPTPVPTRVPTTSPTPSPTPSRTPVPTPSPTPAASKAEIGEALASVDTPSTPVAKLLAKKRFVADFDAPAPGTVSIVWKAAGKVIATGSSRSTSAGDTPITVKLTAAGKRVLKNAGKRLKVAVTATFTAADGTKTTKASSFTLKR